MADWTASDIPAQHGRTLIVTGGTGGLGFETALQVARAGGTVILAGRDASKGAAAIGRIRAVAKSAEVRFEPLDLASLASARAFAGRVLHEPIDVLVNNAGVMTPPSRKVTADGFELQFGTNFLGHFALTALLLPALRNATQPRVVTVTSFGANDSAIDFDDLQSERKYRPMAAYNQSKLADLLFAFEFERRSRENAWGIKSIAAHPGLALTELIPNGAGRDSIVSRVSRLLGPIIMQTPAQGALPSLYASTSPDAVGGAYYGPTGFAGIRGATGPAKSPPAALDLAVAKRLWKAAEQLTGVDFPSLAHA
ncbi:MAG: oxidoreductase [Candidatus Eremiobacteraeota bacterium]|nr:oxidoreductase [Candidatus Eremiobacteraeota bacterium]